jgi:predicted RND superfamily exporter protein
MVRTIQAHAKWVVLAAIGVAAVAAAVATRLELRTSFAELLPSRDPGVVQLHRMEQRLGGFESMVVAIQSPSRDANLRYAAALTDKLSRLPPDLVEIARYEARAERDFFRQRKWLYADAQDIEDARDRLNDDILRKKNPLYVSLEDPPTWDEIESRVRGGAHRNLELPDGYFLSRDGTFATVVVIPPGGIFGKNIDRLYHEAQRIIRETPHPADMQVGLSGDVVTQIEERNALAHDLAGATALTVFLVCVAVVLFYGRLRALPLMATPALIGVTLAFALAELAFGYLNSSTAFLGSIIVGNGINYAIIQLARYEEERRAGAAAGEAGVRAVAGTIRATAVAAGAASISYGSLMLTRFRGFSQFGLIGGAGMILAWAATVIVLPAVLYLLDRKKQVAPRKMLPGIRLAGPVARLTVRRPALLLGAGMALTIASLAVLPRYLADPFEYNFRNLRTVRSSGRDWHSRIDSIFGHVLSPQPLMIDDIGDAMPTKRAIYDRDRALPPPRVVDTVVTVFDLLPGDSAMQQRKIDTLREIHALLHDPAFDLLDDDERKKLAEWDPPPEALAPVTMAQLPQLVLRPFREKDGTVGRVLLMYPPEHGFSGWNGRDLIRLDKVVGEIPLPNGHVVRTSGSAVVFAGMIRSILHDAPIATAASLGGVALLVVLLTPRRRGVVLVISILLMGVLWMVGAAAAAHERVNFLNFIALPITFGIGVDYGINILLRYKKEGEGRIVPAVQATGGAVALCSLTTILGYGALLVAQNRALRSFGGLAILGEIATLAAALLVMPAFLAWRERVHARTLHRHERRARATQAGPPVPEGS